MRDHDSTVKNSDTSLFGAWASNFEEAETAVQSNEDSALAELMWSDE